MQEYFGEGFLAIQLALSQSILAHFGVADSQPTIKMQRFPHPDWEVDPMITIMELIGIALIVCGLVMISANIIKTIIVEKETQVKEVMKIMGVSSWLHWAAWFSKYLLIFAIIGIITVAILCTSIIDRPIFQYSDPIVVFVFLIVFYCSIIALSFMGTVFFKKSSTAAAFGSIAFFISVIPYLYISMSKKGEASDTTIMGLSIFSPSAAGFGLYIINKYEMLQVGIQWHNIWKPPLSTSNVTLGAIMILLVVDIVLYMFVTLYVDAVFPGEYGIPQPWYFLCTSTFWCGQKPYTGMCSICVTVWY